MLFNSYFYPIFPLFNPFPPVNFDPPVLYNLLNSLVNYGKEKQISPIDLAKNSRQFVFDFDYGLTSNVNKEEFEINILNHFIMRRINFESYTLFKIQLQTKLREIIPKYNLLFNSIKNWNLFDGEEVITNSDEKSNSNELLNNITNVETTSTNTSTTETTEDNRNSETPQNLLEDVKNGNYVDNYSFNTNNSNDTSNGNANSNSNSTNDNTRNENIERNENIKRTVQDKLKNYIELLEFKNNIYTSLYNDLDCLFYGIV